MNIMKQNYLIINLKYLNIVFGQLCQSEQNKNETIIRIC